jgi:hypothetical protein
MKLPLPLALSLLAGLATTAVHAQIAPVFSDTFDAYADGNTDTAFLANYNIGAYNVGSAVGLNGSKALVNTVDATIVRDANALNYTTGGNNSFATVSLYFQFAGAFAIASPAIGLVGTFDGGFTGTADIGTRISAGGAFVFRSNNSNVASPTDLVGSGSFTTGAGANQLVSGNWYQIVFELERTDTTNTFNAVASVYASDASGVTSLTPIRSIGATFENANMWADAAVFAAIRENGSINNMDNFELTQGQSVPEPSSAAALAGAIVLFGAAGRRRRRSA